MASDPRYPDDPAHRDADDRPSAGEELRDTVGRSAGRKLRARQEARHTVWFGLGMFGVVGWSVAVPTLAGIGIGLWLDRRWPGDVSWTLTLLFVGIAVGCLNAWYWVRQESSRD